MSKMREDFEEFCKANQIDTEIGSDPYWKGQKYVRPYTQGAWTAWQYLYKERPENLQAVNPSTDFVDHDSKYT